MDRTQSWLTRYFPDGIVCAVMLAYLSPFSKTAACWCNLRLTFHDLKAEFSKLAKREERSTAYMVELAMRDRLAFGAAQIRTIEVGLEQAGHGEVVPHAAVKEWAQSLGTHAELPLPKSKTNPL